MIVVCQPEHGVEQNVNNLQQTDCRMLRNLVQWVPADEVEQYLALCAYLHVLTGQTVFDKLGEVTCTVFLSVLQVNF